MTRKTLSILAPKTQDNIVSLDVLVPRKCEFCRLWDRFGGLDEGRCRRRPPFVNPANKECVWPTTQINDWCGEFRRLPADKLESQFGITVNSPPMAEA